MDDLRGYIVRGPTERLRHVVTTDVLLAHPEVRNLDVSILVQHDIIQLEVSVDHTQGMEENNTDGNFSGVKSAV